ncbi:MAG: amidase, partial [Acidimicrobiia bacterium]
VRTGRIKAVDVAEAALAAASDAQHRLNAFTLIDSEGALARAESIDALVERGEDPGPLAGVPVGLKDLIDQEGLPNTRGGSFPVEPSRRSAPVVKQLEAAGANIIGRTGLHEFAFGFTSENPWFGPVRNPWDIDTSSGGSSGGSAVAVAAGIVSIAVGTDTGGSIRVPAALCGIFGLKVSHGRVPLSGVYPLVPSFDTVGPLARTVQDLAMAFDAMVGDDPNDPWSRRPPKRSTVDPQSQSDHEFDPTSVRLSPVRQWLDNPITHELTAEVDRFMGACSDAGFEVCEIDNEALRPVGAVTMASRAEILEIHGERFANEPQGYGEDVRLRLAESAGVTADDMVVSQRWISKARGTVERLQVAKPTILVSPTVGIRSKHIGVDYVDIDGEQVFHRSPLSRFTAPVNAIGIPALSMPILRSGAPPASVQFAGPSWSEDLLLRAARWLEEHEIVGYSQPPAPDAR